VQPLDHHPARERNGVGAIAIAKERSRLRSRVGRLETTRIRIDACRAKPIELLAAVAHLLGEISL
jgi:hypothetical protein